MGFFQQPQLRTPNIPQDDDRKKKEEEEKARRRAEARRVAAARRGPESTTFTADFAGETARPSAQTRLGGQ